MRIATVTVMIPAGLGATAPDPGADLATLAWILAGGAVMSALALVGGLTLLIPRTWLERLVLPLVALAAGSLLGGALFHMLPAGLAARQDPLVPLMWLALGFGLFLALEQFLHWHHCHRAGAACRQPVGYLLLLGDGVHNFLGGLAVGVAFLVDPRLGATTWLAAAAHEVPQELGDFAVLIHSGWRVRAALLFNVLSALTFPLGGVVAWAAAPAIDIGALLPFAAGNFIYIAASDLVPEVNRHHDLLTALVHLACFAGGASGLWALAVVPG